MVEYRIIILAEGDLLDTTEHDERESAERAFDDAVTWANRQASDAGQDHRVELWGADVLLGIFDTADRP